MLDSTTIPDGLYPRNKKEVKIIGVPMNLFADILEKDMLERFTTTLGKTGCKIVNIEIPSAKPALAAYYIIIFAEVSTNLARFDGMRYGLAKRGKTLLDDYLLSRTEGFGEESRRRILLGTFVLSSGYIDAYYHKADRGACRAHARINEAFERVDVIATPTMPSPAFKIRRNQTRCRNLS